MGEDEPGDGARLCVGLGCTLVATFGLTCVKPLSGSMGYGLFDTRRLISTCGIALAIWLFVVWTACTLAQLVGERRGVGPGWSPWGSAAFAIVIAVGWSVAVSTSVDLRWDLLDIARVFLFAAIPAVPASLAQTLMFRNPGRRTG